MKYIISIVVLAILISCGTGKNVEKTEKNEIHKKWELSVIDGKEISRERPIYIELMKNNKVNGFIGCNQLIGNYIIENESQIKFSQLVTTRMACSETDMALESQVLELLNTTDNFTIVNGALQLNIGRRAPLATFYSMNDNEVVNKYWKLKKIGDNTIEMAANQEREHYFILRSYGTISGFAGCNQFNGQYELKSGNRISINENMAMTLKACPDVDVDESAYLKVFQQANNYSINGEILSLSAGEGAPLAIFEVVYF